MVHCTLPTDIKIRAKLCFCQTRVYCCSPGLVIVWFGWNTKCVSFVSRRKVEVALTPHVVILGLGILWLPIRWDYSQIFLQFGHNER